MNGKNSNHLYPDLNLICRAAAICRWLVDIGKASQSLNKPIRRTENIQNVLFQPHGIHRIFLRSFYGLITDRDQRNQYGDQPRNKYKGIVDVNAVGES